MKNQAIIGLGSNIDPHSNIKKARGLLNKEFQVLGESEFIQTKPIGYTQQDDFINGSVHIETDLHLEALIIRLKELEQLLERKRSELKSGPRTIDLDVIVFNGKVVDLDFYERDFLKRSVLQLIPNLDY